MSAQFLVVDEGGHLSRLENTGAVTGGLAYLFGAVVMPGAGQCRSRSDGAGRTRWDATDVSGRLIEHRMRQTFDAVLSEQRAIRGDDFAAGLGAFNPRDLTQKLREALEETLPPLQAAQIFPINTDIQPGALAYEQSRTYGSGEAVVYSGGSGADIPEVGLGTATMTSKIAYLVSKATINWLENLSSAFAGLNTQARKIARMRRVIQELEDKWSFEGNASLGLFGILGHPYIDTALSTVAYNDDSSADDIATDFGYWANYAGNESNGAFRSDTLMIATKLATALRNRRYGDNADKSLMDWMLSANPHIKRVEEVFRFNDAGGANIHAFAFSRSQGGGMASLEIVKPLTETALPPDARALVTELFTVSGFGGLNQTTAGDNLVVYTTGA